MADPGFSTVQGHDHLYPDLRNGAGTSVGQGAVGVFHRAVYIFLPGKRVNVSESL